MNFEKKFLIHVKAGARVIQLVSYELQRVHGFVNYAATELGREWYVWNRVEGIKKWDPDENVLEIHNDEIRTAENVLEFFVEHEDPMLLILEDFHPDLTEENVSTIKRIRNIAQQSTANDKTLILGQPFYFLPKELEKEVQVLEVPLPSVADIGVIFDEVCKKYRLSGNCVDKTNNLLEAALGLTIMEAEIAFAKASVEKEKLTEAEIPLVIAEKESVIKKGGFLEYYHPQESLEDVGGLEKLKGWLERRGNAFSDGAKDYGLDTPKGVLLLGIPGTGKSLSAKAIANTWNFPLLRLDMGKVFGGIVGESERNIREALKISEIIAPSILWIDEIEKGLAGMTGSASSDSGTASRVFGTFLTWMQEKKRPVFVVATANDISSLPPELLRKGRVDEIFFVDLPGGKARKEILSIHLKKKDRDSEDYDLDELSKASRGFSGAELEEAIKEAMFHAFDRGEEFKTKDIKDAIGKTYPLSKTMGEMIKQLREWAKNRAVFASTEKCEPVEDAESKALPRLQQEYKNPFITPK